MGEDKEVSAEFAEDAKHLLTLTKQGGGQALIKTQPSGLNCGATCSAQTASFYGGEPIEVSWKLNKGTTSIDWGAGAGTCAGAHTALEGSCTLTLGEGIELKAELE
jgi:hypothetical protein